MALGSRPIANTLEDKDEAGVEMSLGQRLMQFAAVQELEQLRLEKQRLQTETRNLEARSTYSYGPPCVQWFQEISSGLKAVSISSALFSEKDRPGAWHRFILAEADKEHLVLERNEMSKRVQSVEERMIDA